MRHYVCVGECRGVSDKPGNCQALGCHKRGEPLAECGCEDGMHHRAPKERERKEKEHDG